LKVSQLSASTVYAAPHDLVSPIQIATTVAAICILSVEDAHTLPSEWSSGAYLDDVLRQFENHLATISRTEMMARAILHLPPAAIYRLKWLLAYLTESDIYSHLDRVDIRCGVLMSTNRIARRLQWLLRCDVWTPPEKIPIPIPGFCVDLRAYTLLARRLLQHTVGQRVPGLTGWLEHEEPTREHDRLVSSSQAGDIGPTPEAVDLRHSLGTPTGRTTRSDSVYVISGVVHRLEGSAAQEPDIEVQAIEAGINATPAQTGARIPHTRNDTSQETTDAPTQPE